MGFSTALYFENAYDECDLSRFTHILENAFEGVKLHSNSEWRPSSLDGSLTIEPSEVSESFKKNGGILFEGPHYYEVTVYKYLICVECFSRVRLLVDEKYGQGHLEEMIRICKKLKAKKVIITNAFESYSDFARKNDFAALESYMILEPNTEKANGTIQELANVNCDYCLITI